MMHSPDDRISRAASLIARSRRLVAFTGAGVSTESGIPDFRSPGGLWDRFDPDDFTLEKFLASPEARRQQWRMLAETGLFEKALPNDAHRVIAWLERIGKLDCVITQNIDGLHQKAGNDPARVYELHGNMRHLRCLGCGSATPLADFLNGHRRTDGEPPVCDHCGGILKPDVVFFGEALPEVTLRAAVSAAKACDLMLVVGSSLVVYPAAYMPLHAKGHHGKIIMINRSETPYDGEADVRLAMGAGEALRRIELVLKAELKI